MRYLSLLLSAFAVFLLSAYTSGTQHTELAFQLLDQKPVVHVILNGRPAAFLLDTGSDLTLLDASAAKSFGFQLRDLPEGRNKVAGIGTYKQSIQLATGVDLKMGGHTIFASFVGMKLSHLNAYFSARGKVPLVGIIGADVMQLYGFVIDYEENRVLLSLPLNEKEPVFAENQE